MSAPAIPPIEVYAQASKFVADAFAELGISHRELHDRAVDIVAVGIAIGLPVDRAKVMATVAEQSRERLASHIHDAQKQLRGVISPLGTTPQQGQS